jgi:hypothetical protein
MTVIRDDDQERAPRIEWILEELRVNTEDLHALTEQALERARETPRASLNTVAVVKQQRSGRNAAKKRDR